MKVPSEDQIPFVVQLQAIEKLNLEPEEAFVFSRVNGVSSLQEIAQTLGYDTARVWRLLVRLVQAGVLDVKEPRWPATKRMGTKTRTILDILDEEDKDPQLSNIPRVRRNEMRLRYDKLSTQNHYEFLAISQKASTEEIRSKYFQLVKDFHPDRFFGKELGEYKGKLEAIFERLSLILEELGDPVRRGHYDASLQARAKNQEKGQGDCQAHTLNKDAVSSAARYYDMGQQEEVKREYIKAANFFQLAVQYDPENRMYQKAWERMKPYRDRKKVEELFNRAMSALSIGDENMARTHLEKVLEIEPKKKECYRELMILYVKERSLLPRAKEMAFRALKYFPKDAKVHTAMGIIHREEGQKHLAIEEFKIALGLDENELVARKALAQLKGE